MELLIKSIEIDCVIGERPDERDRLQRIFVDVRIATGDAAALSDRLEDAVDYATVADEIRARLVEEKCFLIERAALLAANTVKSHKGVGAVEVAVTKQGAVPGIGAATAICRLP